jgi:hypothetical protein
MPTLQRFLVAAAVVAAVAGQPALARAQDYAAARAGLAAAVGVGISSAGITCTPRCGGDRSTGPTYTIRGVANVNPQLAVVVEGNGFYHAVPRAEGAGRWQLTWVTLGAMWYPTEEGDAYLRVGFGAAITHAHATFPTVGALDLNTRDVGMVIGVGRDYRLTERYGFTLHADYMVTPQSVGYLYAVDSGAKVGADVINVGIAAIVF